MSTTCFSRLEHRFQHFIKYQNCRISLQTIERLVDYFQMGNQSGDIILQFLSRKIINLI